MDFLLRSLELRDRLSDGEKALLRALPSRTVTLAAGATIIQEEATASHSCLLVDGFAARCHYIVDGRRQFSAIHLPGDFMDLHGFLLKRLDHGIVALTSCRVALVPHEKLQAISLSQPGERASVASLYTRPLVRSDEKLPSSSIEIVMDLLTRSARVFDLVTADLACRDRPWELLIGRTRKLLWTCFGWRWRDLRGSSVD